MWVADYSLARPGAAALVAAGCTGVMRYIGAGRNDGAIITAAEIADFNAHGLPYGLVLEFEANWLMRGYKQGYDIARAAFVQEQQLGIAPGVTYLACDFDIQPEDYGQALSTIQGCADGYGGWDRVRPYGSKAFCDWVQANSACRGSWSTFAWSWSDGQFRHADDARLWQYNYWPQNVPLIGGCDYNEVLGDWGPRTGEADDMTPEQDNILRTCAKAIVQLAAALNQHINDETQRATLITKGDPTHYGLLQVKADLQAIEAAVKATPPGTTDPGLGEQVAALSAKLDNLTLKASA